MTQNTAQPVIVAYCGLVCTDCGAFKKGKCQGCHSDKPMFRGCPIKKCATGQQFATCADCRDFSDLKRCRKLNNFISKIFGLIFKHDRIGHLNEIRTVGLEVFTSKRA